MDGAIDPMKETWRRGRRNRRGFTGEFSTAIALAALAVVSLTNDTCAESNRAFGTHLGQIHPDFLLPMLGGGFGRLSDYRGKKVLLMHFASW